MTVGEVCRVLDAWAAPGYAYDWDRQGLAVGSASWAADRVLVALTLTEQAVQRALDERAGLVILHHPPNWEPLRELCMDVAATRRCVRLAAAGIACYAAHTSLDITVGGVNDVLAERLGLVDCRPLIAGPHAEMVKLVTFVPEADLAAVRAAVMSAGAGGIGAYTECSFSVAGTGTFVPGGETNPFVGEKGRLNEVPERRFETIFPKALTERVVAALCAAHPYEEPAYDLAPLLNKDASIGLGVSGQIEPEQPLSAFVRAVAEALEVDSPRYAGDPGRMIRRVGVIGGGGASLMKEIPAGLDVLVTGDVGYHDALTALDRGLCVIDATHDGTEKWAIPAVARYLQDSVPGLTVVTHMEPGLFETLRLPS